MAHPMGESKARVLRLDLEADMDRNSPSIQFVPLADVSSAAVLQSPLQFPLRVLANRSLTGKLAYLLVAREEGCL